MGYPNPLVTVSRKISDNIVITSGGFTRVNILNFGSRMALFKVDNNIIVWSAIPYGPEVTKAIELLNGKSTENTFKISHLIIPDREHTMAAISFKEQYPDMKILAPASVDLGEKVKIDYKFSQSVGNRTLKKEQLKSEVGIQEESILNNFEFVFLPQHKNQELVVYHPESKILFEADLLFNLGVNEPLEQFSPQTGYPQGFYPHSGLSFLTRYLQPYSKVGSCMMNKVASSSDAKAQNGLKAIYAWDFNQIVMCHGNVIDKDAKKAFHSLFSSALESP